MEGNGVPDGATSTDAEGTLMIEPSDRTQTYPNHGTLCRLTIVTEVEGDGDQRAEQRAPALEVDTKPLHWPKRGLVEALQVRTKGKRTGMQYWAG